MEKTCIACSTVKDEIYMIIRDSNYFCDSNCYSNFFAIKSTTSNIIKVSSSDVSIMLLDVNVLRQIVTIYNNSELSLYIKYGANATSDSFSLRINSGDYLELPYPCYTGRIDGFWEGIAGNAMITEITK